MLFNIRGLSRSIKSYYMLCDIFRAQVPGENKNSHNSRPTSPILI